MGIYRIHELIKSTLEDGTLQQVIVRKREIYK